MPVLAGTGAASARQAVVLSKRAEDDGADALLVLSPPGALDPRPYYERVTAAVGVPVLAYHYPKASMPGVPVDVLRELPVAGLKDSTGDAERLLIEADELPTGLYTGHPTLIHLAGAIGCSGAILALANVDPEGCLRAWKPAAEEHGPDAFPGNGNPTPAEDELRRLRAEVARLKAERDLLKKAAAYFASPPS